MAVSPGANGRPLAFSSLAHGGEKTADTHLSPIAEAHQSLVRNGGKVIPAAWGGRILRSLRRYRAGSRRTGRGRRIGVLWVSIHSRPVLPGAMDELNPASGVRRSPQGDCPPTGLEAGGTTGAPGSRHGLSAPQSSGWTKAVSDINPDRVARLRSHNTPTTGFGNEASPCRSPGGKDHPHNRATGRFRSSARWHLPDRAQRKFSSSQER